ncbi:MAG: CCA tRNA nucleotidyltransferase, partial [Armatimonadetes bacterium]|nr:CCA tRNA nucleotidyltransferase [Candidatus Hippobium faecium]
MTALFSENIVQILDLLRENLPEYKDKIYLVGGCVRDALLGSENKDLDFCVDGDPFVLSGLVSSRIKTHNFAQNPKFGNFRFEYKGYDLEFTYCRKETYKPKSRFPNTFPGTPEDDVMRRDFTVNSLMVSVYDTGFEIIDISGRGVSDFRNKIIDTLKDPSVSFYEDPLRMFRAVRFSEKLSFEISQRCIEAIKENLYRTEIISSNNIAKELNKASEKALDRMKNFGLI